MEQSLKLHLVSKRQQADDAKMPELLVLEDGKEDVLIAAWIEGSGRASEIVSVVQDSIWSVDDYTITLSRSN